MKKAKKKQTLKAATEKRVRRRRKGRTPGQREATRPRRNRRSNHTDG